MKTILHSYYFNINDPIDKSKYSELRKQLEVSHAGKFFNVVVDLSKHRRFFNETEEVELSTKFLFNNQWNEAGGGNCRLFDWYEAIFPNRNIKEGHWLEITPEMAAIRENTLTCGYCGKYVKVDEPHKWHCEKCLGSQYLKEKDLRLLRLLPVDIKNKNISLCMTDKELAEILLLYKEAQGLGQIASEIAAKSHNRKRVAALLLEAETKARELIEAAKVETEAYTWLLDHDINILDNVIYYNHTKRFKFGWRTPLTNDEKSKFLDILVEFPFDYDLS